MLAVQQPATTPHPLTGENAAATVAPQSPARMQKTVHRRTVDFTAPYIRLLREYLVCPDLTNGSQFMQSTPEAALEVLPPIGFVHQPVSSCNTNYVGFTIGKVVDNFRKRCNAQMRPIRGSANVLLWTPDGRRCLTGSQSGDFTYWNGTHFHHETQIQAHESGGCRAVIFTHNGEFLISGDDGGLLRYWKPNLECLKSIEAHKEAVQGISCAPSDLKFATASDDASVRVWDFATATEEVTLQGHGADVKDVDWHCKKSVIASASRDGLVKVWDPGAGKEVGTLHAHKAMVTAVKWNQNGNWLLSTSRDFVAKVWDIRMYREVSVYTGHTKDVITGAWHPMHEELFVTGGQDGSIAYWLVSRSAPQDLMPLAHEGPVWSLAWHPVGHLLGSGGGDCMAKFWCRRRHADPWPDKDLFLQEPATAVTPVQVVAPPVAAGAIGAAAGVIPGIGEAQIELPKADVGVTLDLPGIKAGSKRPRSPSRGDGGRGRGRGGGRRARYEDPEWGAQRRDWAQGRVSPPPRQDLWHMDHRPFDRGPWHQEGPPAEYRGPYHGGPPGRDFRPPREHFDGPPPFRPEPFSDRMHFDGPPWFDGPPLRRGGTPPLLDDWGRGPPPGYQEGAPHLGPRAGHWEEPPPRRRFDQPWQPDQFDGFQAHAEQRFEQLPAGNRFDPRRDPYSRRRAGPEVWGQGGVQADVGPVAAPVRQEFVFEGPGPARRDPRALPCNAAGPTTVEAPAGGRSGAAADPRRRAGDPRLR